jgi:hypothetical protein
METFIEEIVRKLHSLSEVKVLEVLDFVDFLSCNKERLASQPPGNDFLQDNEEFEAIADRLADEFQMYIRATTPALSDDAVSRAGIYEEHP